MSLSKDYFFQLMAPILETYGKNFYSQHRLERIYHWVSHLTNEQMRIIVVSFIDEGIKPDVPHFKAKAQVHRARSEKAPSEQNVQCEDCADSGLVELLSNDNNLHLIRCDCLAGKQSHWEKLPEVRRDKLGGWRLVRRSDPESQVRWNPNKNGLGFEETSKLLLAKVADSTQFWNEIKRGRCDGEGQ